MLCFAGGYNLCLRDKSKSRNENRTTREKMEKRKEGWESTKCHFLEEEAQASTKACSLSFKAVES